MNRDEHQALAATLLSLCGAVVLSSYPSELYRDLYSGWQRVEKETCASGDDGAVQRTEVLWLNNRAARTRRRQTTIMSQLQPTTPD